MFSNTKLRFGYNITLDLPTFQALRASGSVGAATTANPDSTPENNLPGLLTNFTAETGNPLLKPMFDRRFIAHTAFVLDPELMNAAAKLFEGEHDFEGFTKLNHGQKLTT